MENILLLYFDILLLIFYVFIAFIIFMIIQLISYRVFHFNLYKWIVKKLFEE